MDRKRTFTIAFSLAASFGLLVFVVVAVVLGVELYAAVRNTAELTERAGTLTVELIVDELEDHLHHVETQIDHIGDAFADGAIDAASDEAITTYLRGTLAGLPQVHAVAYLDDRLRAVGVEQIEHDGQEERFSVFVEDWGADRASAKAREVAIAGEEAAWVPVHWQERFGESVVSRVKAVGARGGPAGFVAAWVGVDEITRFLEQIDRLTGTEAFVLQGEHEVIAYGRIDADRFVASADRPLPLLEDIGDRVLAAIWAPEASIEQQIALDEDSGLGFHAVAVDGRQYAFLYRTITDYGEVPWTVGGYIDFEEIHREFARIERSAVIGAVLLVLGIAAAALLGRQISKPVRRIAEAARQIGGLRFEKVPELPGSRVLELDQQARAFNAMVGGLRWFDNYVPRELVRKLMQRGGEIAHEDRPVTILFTDVAGFTALSENQPAGEVARFLNEHFALVVGCIEAHGGTVDKFIGDAVMAIWGAPEADDNQAARACQAALAIVEAMAQHNRCRGEKGEPPVGLRIGVHSGVATVGNIGSPGRINYTIVGDVVNVASRLESLGKEFSDDPAVVLVSQATVDQLPRRFRLRALGGRRVKGRQNEIAVYRLEGA